MEGKMFEIFLFCRRELHILQQFAASKQFQSFVGRAWDGEGSWMVGGLNGRSFLWASRACRVVWGSRSSQELRRISRRRKWCASHESVVTRLRMTVFLWACCAILDRHIPVPVGWREHIGWPSVNQSEHEGSILDDPSDMFSLTYGTLPAVYYYYYYYWMTLC